MSEGSLEPTPRRLERARREGDFGASGAIGSALAWLVGLALVPPLAAAIVSEARARIGAAIDVAKLEAPAVSGREALLAFAQTMALVGPFVLVAALVAALATLVETKFGFAPARLFSGPRGGGGTAGLGGRVARGAVAATVAVALALGLLRALALPAAHVSTPSLHADVTRLEALATRPLAWVSLAVLVFAVGSTFVAHKAHRARLRMTPREVDDERRAGEGDPEVKAARRRVAEQIFSEIPLSGLPAETSACIRHGATAIVVSWTPELDPAPRLVRKAVGRGAETLVAEALAVGLRIAADEALTVALSRLSHGELVGEGLYDPLAELFATRAAVTARS
ncbi:MAG: EscU/YscU/HrcU family type III secretion system export apparatus switch protein [Myxococcales bacterium]|nr:EscU/YscU/HrcU family type III secretion system export apparatus switch protein [Myxococcales bacterium]